MDIKHIIYHILNKEVQGMPQIIPSPNEIPTTETHVNFLTKLTESYASRAGKGFG
ncbi:hypothetical protein Q7284_06800 [Glaesserella parasuis]|nr:hypothetical protein [Glaesserella parasuis]MDP0090247.1 hypothetical protein [Glaesserella parasuis]MDP0326489.1 hypothetical protein [Glaesserella parasuis]